MDEHQVGYGTGGRTVACVSERVSERMSACLPVRTSVRLSVPCRRIAVCLAALLIAGCGGKAVAPPQAAMPAPVVNIHQPPPPPPPPPVKPLIVNLSASASINPGANERPAPVMVRLYDLKSATGFDAADFFALMDREREVLGADLLARDEYQLQPGEQLALSRKLSAGVTRIAVVVAFRDLHSAIWKSSIAIGSPPPAQLKVLIDGRRVRLVAEPGAKTAATTTAQ